MTSNTSEFVVNRLLIQTNPKYHLPMTEAKRTNNGIKILGVEYKYSKSALILLGDLENVVVHQKHS